MFTLALFMLASLLLIVEGCAEVIETGYSRITSSYPVLRGTNRCCCTIEAA